MLCDLAPQVGFEPTTLRLTVMCVFEKAVAQGLLSNGKEYAGSFKDHSFSVV
jgi:hypothetical protein